MHIVWRRRPRPHRPGERPDGTGRAGSRGHHERKNLMTRGHVLVVGGGVGGLSAALALRQAAYDVTVVELHSDVHSSVCGVGIIQPANALRALDAIGCAQACIDAGYPARAWGSLHSADGHFIKEMPGTPIEGATLPPMNGLTRPKLHRILTDRAIEVGVDLRYSTTFSGLAPYADGVEVTFPDGSTGRYDIVVGADGVSSKVRRHVIDAELTPTYIGQSAYRVNLPKQPDVDRIILQTSPHGMAGLVPIGPDLDYLFFNAHMDRPDPAASPESILADLKEHLAGFGGIAGRVRDHYLDDPSAVVLRPEESMISPAPWHRGRIVLIGDAVHAITPHLGQGAAQAIEDGVVLADCLARHADVEAAFAEYTERRYERCKLVVETSLAIAEWEMGRLPDFDNVAATDHVLAVMAQPL
jgi:2-polyprenyl-6-methoxyphenol hydroxylase-like FAD-dependent oxidoreductase